MYVKSIGFAMSFRDNLFLFRPFLIITIIIELTEE